MRERKLVMAGVISNLIHHSYLFPNGLLECHRVSPDCRSFISTGRQRSAYLIPLPFPLIGPVWAAESTISISRYVMHDPLLQPAAGAGVCVLSLHRHAGWALGIRYLSAGRGMATRGSGLDPEESFPERLLGSLFGQKVKVV